MKTDLEMAFTWEVGGESRAKIKLKMGDENKERIAIEIREDKNSQTLELEKGKSNKFSLALTSEEGGASQNCQI